MRRLALYCDEVDCCALMPMQFCSIVVAAAMADVLRLMILIVAMACSVSTVQTRDDVGD